MKKQEAVEKKFISLQTKFSLQAAMITIIVAAIITASLYLNTRYQFRKDVWERLHDVTAVASMHIVPDDFKSIMHPKQELTHYNHVKNKLSELEKAGTEINSVYLIKVKESTLYYVISDSIEALQRSHLSGKRDIEYKIWKHFSETHETDIKNYFFNDAAGAWLTGYAAITKGEKLIGLFAIELDAHEIIMREKKIIFIALFIFACTIPLSLFLGWYRGKKLTAPLTMLRESAENISKHHIEEVEAIESNDEIGELSSAFQMMAKQLKLSFEKIENQNRFLRQEIDERKMVESQLKEYRAKLENLVERRTADLMENQRILSTLLSNLQGIAYRRNMDENWTMLFTSEGLYYVTGYSPEEMVGGKGMSFKSIILDEDLPELEKKIIKAVENNLPFEHNYRVKTKDNQIVWVWEQGRAIYDDSGKVRTIEGFITDINDLKKAEDALIDSEKKYRILVEDINDVIFSIDSDTALTYISPHFKILTGVDPANAIGYRLTEFVYEEDLPILMETIEETLYGELNADTEFRIKTVKGDPIWIHFRGRNEIADGKFEGMRGVFSDISERKQVEEDLRHAKEEADEANRTKSIFLANMSHEIRTPMNAILGFTEVLEGKIKDETQLGYLKSISASGKNLLGLINDILDLSKIEVGKIVLNYDVLHIETLMEELKQIFKWKIEQKELEYIYEKQDSVPESIFFDEIRLRQILMNLIGNAIKFTDVGHIKISLSTEQKREKRCKLVFEIIDTGIGIEENQHSRIFEAFRQKSGQNEAKYGGTGLGLSITKKLVELMGGTISLTSQVNEGSCFRIEFPDVEMRDNNVVKTKTNVDPSMIEFEEATILIVDDVELNRSLIMSLLEKHHFKMLEATNGKEAIEKAFDYKPDLIFMDMKMNIMNGYEATKFIKDDDELKNIPVVAVTAFAMKGEEKRIYDVGCDDIIFKPVSNLGLILAMMKYIPYTEIDTIIEEDVSNADINEEISKEVLEKLPELVKMINSDLMKDWESLNQTPIISKMQEFAGKIQLVGEDYGLAFLKKWGDTLVNQAQNFDVENLHKTFDKFPDMIQKIKVLSLISDS